MGHQGVQLPDQRVVRVEHPDHLVGAGPGVGRDQHVDVGRWALWFGMVVLVTVVLVPVRSEADQGYIPLAYLLIVLGGSLGAGRRLGFALATVSFLAMDYFLQMPYNRVLNFGRPADFVTLIAFYAVAGVVSRLLDTARDERDLAVRRAEIGRAHV